MPATIPFTVIGGFLGAGKTTLLNTLLRANHGIKLAVMVNDFGDIAIDDAIVDEHDGETLTFANGCVCCTLGDNFMRSLDRLISRESPPQQILVEASGVADPASIADIAVLHPKLRRDLVIVLAAAESVYRRASDELTNDTVQRQLNAADMIVLNKVDLIDAPEERRLKQWFESRSRAPVITTEQAQLPMNILAANDALVSATERFTATKSAADEVPRYKVHQPHSTFTTVTLSTNHPIDSEKLTAWANALPETVLRMKGFFRTDAVSENVYFLQRSGRQLEVIAWEKPLPETQQVLVVIGTKTMPDSADLAQGLKACEIINH